MVMTKEAPVPAGTAGVAQVRVVGVGGGGVNAILRMQGAAVPGVQFLCINTDANSLERAKNMTCVRIGDNLTRGLGAGGNPEVGLKAAAETKDSLTDALRGADLVFLTAGMGGGTGTGAAPLVAEIARNAGALCVAVVTTPFSFEGARRMATATAGLQALKGKVDTLIVIGNDRLLATSPQKMAVQEAFRMADQVVMQAIMAVSRVINVPGDINVDFADVKAIMQDAGSGIMAIGHGQGEHRTLDAARFAIANPLLDTTIEGAKGVLFTVAGGADLTLAEVNAAGQLIAETVDPDAQIFFGMTIDQTPKRANQVEITLIATKLPERAQAHNTPGFVPARLGGNGASSDVELPAFLRSHR